MNYFIFILLFFIILFIYLNYTKYIEHFHHYLPITDLTDFLKGTSTLRTESASKVDNQDIIINNSTHNTISMGKNKILSERDSNLIPTYALYQPEVSGRHLHY